MNSIPFDPLGRPDQWPPPSPPDASAFERRLKWIPILGWIGACFMSFRRVEVHNRRVLYPLEAEIEKQIASRPKSCDWPVSARQTQIVEIISEIVDFQKGIKSATLHPEDLYGLLLWGTGFELTPLSFRLELLKTFGLSLSDDEMRRFWLEEWTLRQVVEHCDERIQQLERHAE